MATIVGGKVLVVNLFVFVILTTAVTEADGHGLYVLPPGGYALAELETHLVPVGRGIAGITRAGMGIDVGSQEEIDLPREPGLDGEAEAVLVLHAAQPTPGVGIETMAFCAIVTVKD